MAHLTSPEARARRFWSLVDRAGPILVGMTTPCWLWRGRSDKGDFYLGAFHSRIAARISWELSRGEIPAGRIVCHKCDNPPCVNPDHLYVGTHKDNTRDRYTRGNMRFGGPTPLPREPQKPASGLHPGQRHGEQHHKAKLSEKQVLEIRARASKGESLASIAEKYPVTLPTVHQIVQQRTWRHLL